MPEEFEDGRAELISPEDLLPSDPFPIDARRLGIDRFTGDNGALIALAASLDPGKASHKVVAWVLLVAIAGPELLTFWTQVT